MRLSLVIVVYSKFVVKQAHKAKIVGFFNTVLTMVDGPISC